MSPSQVNLDIYLLRTPLLSAAETARPLGYPSTSALAKARQTGRLPNAMFKVPGRRGWFSATQTVRAWLDSLLVSGQPSPRASRGKIRDRSPQRALVWSSSMGGDEDALSLSRESITHSPSAGLLLCAVRVWRAAAAIIPVYATESKQALQKSVIRQSRSIANGFGIGSPLREETTT